MVGADIGLAAYKPKKGRYIYLLEQEPQNKLLST